MLTPINIHLLPGRMTRYQQSQIRAIERHLRHLADAITRGETGWREMLTLISQLQRMGSDNVDALLLLMVRGHIAHAGDVWSCGVSWVYAGVPLAGQAGTLGEALTAYLGQWHTHYQQATTEAPA